MRASPDGTGGADGHHEDMQPMQGSSVNATQHPTVLRPLALTLQIAAAPLWKRKFRL